MQLTLVLVVCRAGAVTVTWVDPELPEAWLALAEINVAVMVWLPVPTAVGVYVTEHLALAPGPGLRVQLLGGTNVLPLAALKAPTPLVVKVTVPVGVLRMCPMPMEATSMTTAVQIVEPPTVTVVGVHVTFVLVGWRGEA